MKQKLLLFLYTGFFSIVTYGQGCSDAGFCTMGAMRPDQPYSKGVNIKLRSVELNQYRGTTSVSPTIYVTSIDFNFSINDKTSLQLKVPYQSTSGSFGSLSGLGDISISASRNVYSSDKFDIGATIGTKIPSNKSDKTGNKSDIDNVSDLVLPMYYQTSLGSYDFILGASLINKKWLLAVGFQMALTENNNSFDTLQWQEPVYPSNEYVARYDHATSLKRGADVMLRIERNFRYDRFNYYIGLLPIYRIIKDEIEIDNERVKLDGTTGLAFTVLAGGGYHFNAKSSLRLTLGIKLLDRDVNPDGLTRNDVSSLGYIYKF